MVKQTPLNVVWKERSGEVAGGTLIKLRINVPESGIIEPGYYEVDVKGNTVYWPIEREKK